LPGIIQQGAPTYHAATALTKALYVSRWLLLTAVLYLVSALAYVVKAALHQRRLTDTPTGSPPPADTEPAASFEADS
jgi:hypothetical protein